MGEIKLMETREGDRITHATSIELNMLHACIFEREVKTKGNER